MRRRRERHHDAARRKIAPSARSAAPLLASAGPAQPRLSTRTGALIVSFAAGGPNDRSPYSRPVPVDYLGQQFVVEDRVGAGGNVACRMCCRRRPMATPSASSLRTTPSMPRSTSICRSTSCTTVRGGRHHEARQCDGGEPSFPAQNLAEFIAMAKADPGKINFASGGVGTSPHMSGELLEAMAGIKLTHVAYRGTAPAMTESARRPGAGAVR